jgi:hypothetical protein
MSTLAGDDDTISHEGVDEFFGCINKIVKRERISIHEVESGR